MKAGLWILVCVIVAGIVVGSLLKRGLNEKVSEVVEQKLAEIEKIDEPDSRLLALEQLLSEDQPDRLRRRIYRRIAATMLSAKTDTSGFVRLAQDALQTEQGSGSRTDLFYYLYLTESKGKAEVIKKVLESDQLEGWIYNYMAYDLFERGEDPQLGLSLVEKAIELAESKMDSAMYLDTRGAIYLTMGSHLKALADLKVAAGMVDEPDVEILKHLAEAYLVTGDQENALRTYRSILLAGEYDFARSAIDSLMDLQGATPTEREEFERDIWEKRLSSAKTAHAFTLRGVDGGNYEFQPSTSPVTLIALMSPTCGACIAELPHLQKIFDEYHGQGVEMIAIDVTDRAELTKRIFDEKSISLKLLFASPDEARRIFNPAALPTTLVIDKGGRIIFRHIGFYKGLEHALRKEIEALIYRTM